MSWLTTRLTVSTGMANLPPVMRVIGMSISHWVMSSQAVGIRTGQGDTSLRTIGISAATATATATGSEPVLSRQRAERESLGAAVRRSK